MTEMRFEPSSSKGYKERDWGRERREGEEK
jgi:hypothetical protein